MASDGPFAAAELNRARSNNYGSRFNEKSIVSRRLKCPSWSIQSHDIAEGPLVICHFPILATAEN